jgi:hypothetical protein
MLLIKKNPLIKHAEKRLKKLMKKLDNCETLDRCQRRLYFDPPSPV